MAVELRSRLTNGLDLAAMLPATLVFDHPSLEAIAVYLHDKLFASAASTEIGSATKPLETDDFDLTTRETEIDAMSDEEAEALLLDKLAGLDDLFGEA